MATEHQIGGMQEDIRATSEMSAGTVEQIRHDAMARVTTVKEDLKRLETAEKEANMVPARGNSEARVYGDIAADALAPGARVVTAVAEFLGDRSADKGIDVSGNDPNTRGIVSPHARTIEEDIGMAGKKPGVYRMQTPHSVYGETPSDADTSSQNFSSKGRITDQSYGATIGERSALATMSLEGQGKDAIKTWGIEEKSAKLGSVKYAKELTFHHDIANQAALDSVRAVQKEHSMMQHKAMQMAPGLSMANGPTFNPAKVLREAEQELWKQGTVS